MGARARAAPRLRLRCYLITTAWIVGAEKLHTVYIRFNAWAAPVDKPQLDYIIKSYPAGCFEPGFHLSALIKSVTISYTDTSV